MRILLVCYESPLDRYSGAGQRTNNIWRALNQLGEVSALVMEAAGSTVLDPTPREGEIGRISFRKPMLPWTTPGTRKIRGIVAQLAASQHYDFVIVRYLRLALLVRGAVAAPMVVDGDDLDKVATKAGKPFWRTCVDAFESVARRFITRRALADQAHIWFVNPQDMAKYSVRSGSLLPNITDAPAALLPRAVATTAVVLMVGKFGYAPNAEGADFFIREVLPKLRRVRPETLFRMVGQCPSPQSSRWSAVEGVQVAGFVDDLSLEYARATVVVAPVFSGGGTQIKVLESLGHGCGTVISEFSAAGFAPNLRDGEHLLVARSVAGWVDACLKLIDSPELAQRLGIAGRGVVLQKYSFEAMAGEVRSTLTRLAGSGR